LLVDATSALPVTNDFGYNLRSEVTNAVMGANAYGYAYDPVGNRKQSAIGNGQSADVTAYAANLLNQYSAITNSATSASPRETFPAYDQDGNMLTNGLWVYTWDAENRLVSACSNGVLLVMNAYDHRSRRIRKEVSVRESPSFEFQVSSFRTYLWDNWNIIRETISGQESSTTNYYTWGLDLSGTLQGAGGVGGLLAVTTVGSDSPQPTVYYPTYDANGNVTGYVDTNGAVVARYEYSPFGGITAQSGDLADDFTHRFSTKPFDAETGLYYYGYRFYSSELGRWVSRDPIGEDGGNNLYCVTENNIANKWDLLGLVKFEYDTLVNASWYWIESDGLGEEHRSVPDALSYNCDKCRLKFTVTIKFKIYLSTKFKTVDSVLYQNRYRTKRGVYGHEQRHILADQNYWNAIVTEKLSPLEGVHKSLAECDSVGKSTIKTLQDDYNLTFLLMNSGHKVLTQEMENKFMGMNLPIYPGWKDIPANGVDYEPLDGVMPPNASVN